MKIDIAQISQFDPMLQYILLDIEKRYRVEFEITSMMRDDGVHNTFPLRATDLGCPDMGLGRLIEHDINSKYAYDPERPYLNCCVYHDAGNGLHLHLQTHRNTKINEVTP